MAKIFTSLAVILTLAAGGAALAQSVPVFQDGTVQPNDIAKFERNGMVRGGVTISGDNNGMGANPFAVTDFGQAGICTNSSKAGGPYSQFCLGHDESGNGVLSFDSIGGEPAHQVNCRIDGVLVPNCLTQNSPVSLDTGCPNILAFGGLGNGVFDNTAAFAAAVAANPAKVCVQFPPGTFFFGSHLTVNLPASGAGGCTLIGAGPGVTTLAWTGSAGGITCIENSPLQAARFVGFDMTTSLTGGGTCITLGNTVGNSPPQILHPMNVFDHVVCHGADGYGVQQYWSTGFQTNSVSNVAFRGVQVTSSGGGAGDGINLSATSSNIAAVFSISDSQFICVNHGLIVGDQVQGVAIVNSNFVCGHYGIYVPATSSGLDQLSVSNSEFEMGISGIYDAAGVSATLVHGNLFIMSTAGAHGMDMLGGTTRNITGNECQVGNATSVCIHIAQGLGSIGNNTIISQGTGILLDPGSFVQIADTNVYYADVLDVVDNSAGNSLVDGTFAWTPVLAGDSTAGTPTQFNTGIYYSKGAWVTAKFTITATAIAGMAGNVKIDGLPFHNTSTANDYGSCSVAFESGLTLDSPNTMINAIIAPSASSIELWEGTNSSQMSKLPVSALTLPSAIILVGECQYHRI